MSVSFWVIAIPLANCEGINRDYTSKKVNEPLENVRNLQSALGQRSEL